MIDAWASMKSFAPKDGSGKPPGLGRNGERSFHKEKLLERDAWLNH